MKWIAVVGLASAVAAVAAVRARPHAERHTSSVTAPGDAAAVRVTAFFERNDGRAPRVFRYLARHAEHEFSFAPSAVAIAISDDTGSSVVELRFDGGRAQEPEAEQPSAARANYLRGAATSDRVVDVPTFERIRYPEVYRGIDAVFYASGPRVEYDLVVAPHADPSVIALAFDGAAWVRVGETGDLFVETSHGSMIQRKPDVYQVRGERRVAVPAAYRVDGTRALLALGAYDAAEMLVIDPVIADSACRP